MSLSNFSTKIAANDTNSSYIHHNDQNEPKSSFSNMAYNNANNYDPLFSQIDSKKTECFKGDFFPQLFF